jgi:hypothetical protein
MTEKNEFDAVLKRMLSTPPAPQVREEKKASKREAKKQPAKARKR